MSLRKHQVLYCSFVRNCVLTVRVFCAAIALFCCCCFLRNWFSPTVRTFLTEIALAALLLLTELCSYCAGYFLLASRLLYWHFLLNSLALTVRLFPPLNAPSSRACERKVLGLPDDHKAGRGLSRVHQNEARSQTAAGVEPQYPQRHMGLAQATVRPVHLQKTDSFAEAHLRRRAKEAVLPSFFLFCSFLLTPLQLF